MVQPFAWNDGERVMFLGDAITEDPLGYSRLAPALVTARYPELHIEYMVRGVGGNKIGDAIDRLDRDIFGNTPSPSWVCVSLGLNDARDVTRGTPLGRFREFYHVLLERLAQRKARVLCCTTTVLSEDLDNESNRPLESLNEAIRAVAFEHGAEVADMYTVFIDAIRRARAADPDYRYTTNGVMPDTNGRYLMALTLLDKLHFTLAPPQRFTAGGEDQMAA